LHIFQGCQVTDFSIPQGQDGQNYYGWFRKGGVNIVGQSFVPESATLSSVGIHLDIGATGTNVAYRVLVKDMATSAILYISAIRELAYLNGESLGYGRPGEFRTISVGLDNTRVVEGRSYAILVELVAGNGGVQAAINAGNPYKGGTLLVGSSVNQLRPMVGFDMAITVTAGPNNAAPVAVADSATTSESSSVVIDVLVNDTDPDVGDTRQLVSTATDGLKGTVAMVDGRLVYTPGSAFNDLKDGASATESFTYVMRDNAGMTSTAPVTVTVRGENDAPVASADSASVLEGEAVAIAVLTNDSDPDRDDTREVAAIDTGSTKGNVTLGADGSVTYVAGAAFETLAAGQTATDDFSYTIRDGVGATPQRSGHHCRRQDRLRPRNSVRRPASGCNGGRHVDLYRQG
jgi:VCBS repeat-containing protein